MTLAAALWLAGQAAPARADDRHAGYYYPPPETVETYVARATTLEGSDRSRRIGFVVGVTARMMQQPYPPTYALFAKGAEEEKLILVSLRDDCYTTLFQMCGLLAQLTAVARGSPIFADMKVEDFFTFFDLLKLLGFTQLTVSDGRDWAHQVLIR